MPLAVLCNLGAFLCGISISDKVVFCWMVAMCVSACSLMIFVCIVMLRLFLADVVWYMASVLWCDAVTHFCSFTFYFTHRYCLPLLQSGEVLG